MASWLSIGGDYSVGYNPSSCGTGAINKLACYGNPTGAISPITVGSTVDFWQEDHGDDQFALWGTSPYLTKSNVFPLIRCDTRRIRNEAGNLYYDVDHYTEPSVFAQSIYNAVAAFRDVFPAGKEFRYGLFIEGPDGLNSPLFLARNPADSITSGIASPFPSTGVDECEAYYTEAFETAASLLSAGGFNDPEYLISNIESRGDVASGFVVGSEEAALADGRASTYLIDGVQTLAQWYASRQTMPNGQPYPSYPVDGQNQYHTVNHDRVQRYFQAITTAWAYAIYKAISAPAKLVWPNVKFGEWDLCVSSRLSPTPLGRPQKSYDGVGTLCGLDLSIPVCQSSANITVDGGYDPTNTGYPFRGNWQSHYGEPDGDSDTLDVRLGSLAISTMIDDILGNQLRAFMPNYGSLCSLALSQMQKCYTIMGDSILSSVESGAEGIYIFEPSLHTSADKQQVMADMVDYVSEG